MTTVRVKTKTGNIMSYTFDSIIDIDGHPYRSSEESAATHEECKQAYAYLSGRIDTLERLVSQPDEVTGTAAV